MAAVIDHDGARATAAALDGAALFAKRDKGDSGPSYEGEGYTDYLFDFRLAAILEYAKREHNLEVSVAEPYPTVLANSAAFRVSKAKP